ncbi:MAG: hypothetical protein AVDCRST_MAG04-1946 [uncultured Acetobacteraceae bacterium]|uniref:Uncharacterized protein n=1 Tax=uncultured Acetobacteraceae bacterium TaxID=169975 RepID=A0A6J4IC49_9PROT|nr:MAG: hypothetical protein AVDCRST_MAG04-1946 [uncultured Acetobacteraceae bacterium]
MIKPGVACRGEAPVPAWPQPSPSAQRWREELVLDAAGAIEAWPMPTPVEPQG